MVITPSVCLGWGAGSPMGYSDGDFPPGLLVGQGTGSPISLSLEPLEIACEMRMRPSHALSHGGWRMGSQVPWIFPWYLGPCAT